MTALSQMDLLYTPGHTNPDGTLQNLGTSNIGDATPTGLEDVDGPALVTGTKTAGATALDVNSVPVPHIPDGDFAVEYEVQIPETNIAATSYFAYTWDTVGIAGYYIQIHTGGTGRLAWIGPEGFTTPVVAGIWLGRSPGDHVQYRFEAQGDDGIGNNVFRAYSRLRGEPTFVMIGAPIVTAGVKTHKQSTRADNLFSINGGGTNRRFIARSAIRTLTNITPGDPTSGDVVFELKHNDLAVPSESPSIVTASGDTMTIRREAAAGQMATTIVPVGHRQLINPDPTDSANKLDIPDLSAMDGGPTDNLIAWTSFTLSNYPASTLNLVRLGLSTSLIQLAIGATGDATCAFRDQTGAVKSVAGVGPLPKHTALVACVYADRSDTEMLGLRVYSSAGLIFDGTADISTVVGNFTPTTGIALSGIPASLEVLTSDTTAEPLPEDTEKAEIAAAILATGTPDSPRTLLGNLTVDRTIVNDLSETRTVVPV